MGAAQTEAAVLDGPGDGVVAARRLGLDPRRDPLDVGLLLVEGHVAEHRHVEGALTPPEVGLAGPAGVSRARRTTRVASATKSSTEMFGSIGGAG